MSVRIHRIGVRPSVGGGVGKCAQDLLETPPPLVSCVAAALPPPRIPTLERRKRGKAPRNAPFLLAAVNVVAARELSSSGCPPAPHLLTETHRGVQKPLHCGPAAPPRMERR